MGVMSLSPPDRGQNAPPPHHVPLPPLEQAPRRAAQLAFASLALAQPSRQLWPRAAPWGKNPAAKGGEEGGWLGETGLSTSPSRQSGFTLPKAKRMEPQSQELMAGSGRAHNPFLGV